jgi:hypothetical protein
MAWLIPFVGVEALRRPVELIFFVPFGTAPVLGLLGALILLLIGWAGPSTDQQKQTSGTPDAASGE